MENEIWKDIPGHTGYQVSSLGRVKSLDRNVPHSTSGYLTLRGRILTPRVCSSGYMMITLFFGGQYKRCLVHRLVLLSFEWRADHGILQANHRDGVKVNNSKHNLEWCTPSENRTHAVRVLGHKPPQNLKGALNHNAQPVIGRNIKTGEVKEYGCMVDAVADGHKITDISNCTGRRQKTAHGWEWRKPDQEWQEPKKPRPELTSCSNGHPYSLENTIVNKRGYKVCRICNKVAMKKACKKYRANKKLTLNPKA